MFAAAERGCTVTTLTVSQEQHALARARIQEAGLEDRVDIRLQDYRDIDGSYDAVVSIEMLEAVGHEYLPAYFEVVDRVLRPGGRAAIQVITFPDATYERQRRGANWIQTYIFPGGLCPSLAVMERAMARTRLLVTGVEDIAPSYVATLREWRTRFMARLDDVRAQGFDERFIRMWEYYLAISEAVLAGDAATARRRPRVTTAHSSRSAAAPNATRPKPMPVVNISTRGGAARSPTPSASTPGSTMRSKRARAWSPAAIAPARCTRRRSWPTSTPA